jgi:hypothetical protein
MEKYEYKVDAIQAAVAEGDIRKGVAGAKVGSQVELKLGELARQGYEFYREFAVPVKVARGCVSPSKNAYEITIIVMVFRRPVQ